MTRKALRFLRGFGSYNAGETACFDADRADELIAQKVAVVAKDQPTADDSNTISLGMDPRESEAFKAAAAEIALAAQDVQERGSALDQREAELVARAEDLDRRAAEIKATGAAAAQEQALEATEAGADADKATGKATGLPKQGR